MTREKFTQLAPVLVFAAMIIPDQAVFTCIACLLAGATMACRFSLNAEEPEDEEAD